MYIYFTLLFLFLVFQVELVSTWGFSFKHTGCDFFEGPPHLLSIAHSLAGHQGYALPRTEKTTINPLVQQQLKNHLPQLCWQSNSHPRASAGRPHSSLLSPFQALLATVCGCGQGYLTIPDRVKPYLWKVCLYRNKPDYFIKHTDHTTSWEAGNLLLENKLRLTLHLPCFWDILLYSSFTPKGNVMGKEFVSMHCTKQKTKSRLFYQLREMFVAPCTWSSTFFKLKEKHELNRNSEQTH